MAVISGANYLAVANAYAVARQKMLNAVADFYTPIEVVVNTRDVQTIVDLLPELNIGYGLNKGRLEATTGFESMVRIVNQHVAREGNTAGNVATWIAANVVNGVIPYDWAVLSKLVGFDLDSVIDPETNPAVGNSSSSSSS